jgi:hypothetical protein
MPLDSPTESLRALDRQHTFEQYITDVQEMIQIAREAQDSTLRNRFDALHTIVTLADKVEGHYTDLTNSTQWLIGFPALSTVKNNVTERLETRKRKARVRKADGGDSEGKLGG